MNLIEWKDFLVTEGAEFRDQVVVHFGNSQQECAISTKGNIITNLSHVGLIGMKGSDVTAFLQGQMTCDIQEVGHNHSCLGAWCNAKGRVRITFRVLQLHEDYYLELPSECVEDTIKQLHKYIFRSKVVLRDATGERIRMGCSGPTIEEKLHQFFPDLPSESGQVIHEGTAMIIRLGGPFPRFEIFWETEPLINLWNTLKVNAIAVGMDAWSILDVLSGIPIITRATTEAFVPHMLNLPEIGAVSFRKGCYTGQEVVARTQYLGKSKRRLYLAHIPGEESPIPGDPLWAPTEGADSHSGQIVNLVFAPEGGFLLLAVIAIADVQRGEVRLRGPTGPRLGFRPLPYPCSEE